MAPLDPVCSSIDPPRSPFEWISEPLIRNGKRTPQERGAQFFRDWDGLTAVEYPRRLCTERKHDALQRDIVPRTEVIFSRELT